MFNEIKKQYLKEIDSTAYLYEHTSGAKLIYIENKDDNKVFSVTFQTLPFDDTGVFHILEHCVLCGSKKYNSEDPFNDLQKSSLYTYLNAMTFSDKTMYPVASRNNQDFINLVEVYLDAVFNPLIHEREHIFLREGWRYENGEYNGIVYNEMKGAYSDIYRQIESYIMKELFKDTAYQYSSGGKPSDIVKLTYKELLDAYDAYYKPDNAYFYLYGDLNIFDIQKMIHEQYLKDYNNINVEKRLNIIQQPVKIPFKKCYLPKVKDTYVVFAYVIGSVDNTKLFDGVMVLNNILTSTQSSILSIALQPFCEDMSGGVYGNMLQPVFRIIVKNPKLDIEKLKEVINTTLQDLVKNGIDEMMVQGIINKSKFAYKEQYYKYKPKGLVYNIKMIDSWINGFDPFSSFNTLSNLEGFSKSHNFFEKLIDEYILNNKHQVCMLFEPQNNMPKLQISDIKKTADQIQYENHDESLILVKTETDIAYIKFMFETASVPQEKLSYIGILSYLLGKLDTVKYKYTDLNNEVNYYLGGFNFGFSCYEEKEFSPRLNLNIKLLKSNLEQALHIAEEVINNTKFEDKSRIKNLLTKLLSRYEKEFVRNGNIYAISRAKSYVMRSKQYSQYVYGIDMYYFLKKLVSNFDLEWERLKYNLYNVSDYIFTKHNLTTATNYVSKYISKFSNKLRDIKYEKVNFDIITKYSNEAFITLSESLYNVKISSFDKKLYSGHMEVLSTIIDNDYLTNEVRVKGGAYGSHSIMKPTGVCYFYSYRDPNLKRTLEVYDNIALYLKQCNLTQQDLNDYIIATINRYDRPKHDSEKMDIAIYRYMAKIKNETIQRRREEILSTKPKNISNYADAFSEMQSYFCVFGSEKEILESENIFQAINDLQ